MLEGPTERGRQAITLQVGRGVRRLWRALGYATVSELILTDGRRADIVALGTDASVHIIEIKSSLADFRADQKWSAYRRHCDRFYFAIPPDVPVELMPPDTGLIVADSYGAAIVREAAHVRLNAAARRGLLLRFAQAAAWRLHAMQDPAAGQTGSAD
jgi:hypothetical protein